MASNWLGSVLGLSESSLPSQYSTLTSQNVPWLQGQAQTLQDESTTLYGQGQSALSMAQQGQLTAPQQAELTQYTQGLENTAAQQYAAQGRSANTDTSFISTQADIDSKVNAMAQQEIQTTIQLGLGELSSASSFAGGATSAENAASQALISAGQAQLTLDTDYSNTIGGIYSSIFKMAGTAAGAAIGA